MEIEFEGVITWNLELPVKMRGKNGGSYRMNEIVITDDEGSSFPIKVTGEWIKKTNYRRSEKTRVKVKLKIIHKLYRGRFYISYKLLNFNLVNNK